MSSNARGRRHSTVWVSLTGDEKIKIYDMDSDSGALKLWTTNDAHGPSGALCLHPSGGVAWAAHPGGTTLASFRLDEQSGQLTLINMIDTGIATPAHIAVDSAARFLLTDLLQNL